MDEYKSKVYIKTDERNCILRCEGGYTMGNIQNIEEWIFLDEGTGDKYNLCQSHYLEGGIYTEDFIPRWKYENSEAVLRTDAEIEADRAQLPEPLDPYDAVWSALDAAYANGYQTGVDSI